MQTLGRKDRLEPTQFKRPRRLDIERCTDPAILELRLRALENLGAADQFGCQKIEAEFATLIVAGKGAAIYKNSIEGRAKATHRDEPAFARAAVNRDAWNALQGFCDV